MNLRVGGMITAEAAFATPSLLVVTADGHVYAPGPTTKDDPGALVAPIEVRALSAAGVAKLLDAAKRAGLLGKPPKYTPHQLVPDAPSTRLIVSDSNGTYVHDAVGLGIDEVTSGADAADRARLKAFVDSLVDLDAVVGTGALGPITTYQPDKYRIAALPTSPATGTTWVWPAATGISLADTDLRNDSTSNLCGVVSADSLKTVIPDAKQNDLFVDEGQTYRVGIRPAIPSDRPCAGELPEGGSTASNGAVPSSTAGDVDAVQETSGPGLSPSHCG
ncbi:MAG TPA: hypothetical protein PKV27_10950, partial [Ilumatobacteraceae bacterium]|nr:hypothetical protein [Ilumatobacteraceae bacterium]